MAKPDVAQLKASRDFTGLLQALNHKDADIRLEAVIALAELPEARSLTTLLIALRDQNESVRRAAQVAQFLVLLGGLEHGDGNFRASCADMLEKIGAAGAFETVGYPREKVSRALSSSLERDHAKVAARAALEQLGRVR
jgi:HEAT repeat protein